LIALPVDHDEHHGVYDDRSHSLVPVSQAVLNLNRTSVAEILGANAGTTLQIAADRALVEACYANSSSLLWREAGALAATISLVAAALRLEATLVGRTGESIVRAAGFPAEFSGAGAVHLGTRNPKM
jgi:phage-related tail fiber protein